LKRQFDLIIYGASGFVGKQTVAYIRQHYPHVKLAIAGRDLKKLAVIAQLNGLHDRDQIFVAPAHDLDALNELARQTQVVLSTAGPFALYGSGLVAACVKNKTHYVDITGETPWVRQMIDLHHEQSVVDGTCIVPCCGFDSVPSDIGAFLCADEIQRRFHEPCAQVRAVFNLKGGVNGGTLASIANIMSVSKDVKAVRDLFLLNPSGQRPELSDNHADVLLPSFDRDLKTWVGPFVMASINTRVVRRSAALQAQLPGSSYAANFAYQEYMGFGKGIKASLTANTVALGLGAGAIGMQFQPARSWALSLGPAPGAGPTQESMNAGGFVCDYVAKSKSGRALQARMTVRGDPGNRATTLFVCEAAVQMLLQADQRGSDAKLGGVLTPASAFGHQLAQRLKNRPTQYEFAFQDGVSYQP
jgi:short subunit dehydrogenase-like uncharacterized protein